MTPLTPQQQRAVATGGNVLVVAGAGTGKTRTLVERCLARLLDPIEPAGLDQILMVTFTEAAAAEMKERIRARLNEEWERAAAADARARLEAQLALLDTACIGTLHSFCLRLVREHFHELGLDPQVVVLPEEQAQLLRQETLDQLLEPRYPGADERGAAFEELIVAQARGREQTIRDLILRLHDYTQTLPDPPRWFAEQLAHYRQPEPVAWRLWWLEGVVEWKNSWLPVLRAQPAENTNAVHCASLLEQLPARPGAEQVARTLAAVVAVDRDWPSRKKTQFRQPLEEFFEDAAFLHSLVRKAESLPTPGEAEDRGPASPAPRAVDPLTEDWHWVRGQMETLLGLAQEFGRAYAAAKREQAALDFHDLEQFALRLLWDAAADRPTPLAQRLRARFRFVFVDEYQDINAAQDKIIEALSGEGAAANRFLVGDVKQSIYRFRLANPHIFQGYKRAWAADPTRGTVIPLTDNFRSREALLGFVNQLFAGLMRESVGGVAYDAEAALQFGARSDRAPLAAGTGGPCVEVHLRLTGRDEAGESDDSSPDAEPGPLAGVADLTDTEHEARLVARRLRELKEAGHPVWDERARRFRPAQWADMVVLLRALRGRAEVYAKEFHRLGVPLQVARGGFYESAEISDLLSLLQLLDNPLQDVPLLAVLRSPLVGLTLDELAQIRLAAPRGLFWTALRRWHEEARGRSEPPTRPERDAPEAAAPTDPSGGAADQKPAPPVASVEGGPHLFAKVDTFLRRYSRWRGLARETSLSRRLEAVLNETGYYDLLGAVERGAQRQANVRRLLALAEQFDPFQRQGLQRFLRFVQAQQEAEITSEPEALLTPDAVRLTTIHQSKGLEFPIVVVADLGRAFNLLDLRRGILLDEHFGLCPQVKPPDIGRCYPSLPYWRARRRQRRETLGEEMRLLYVALTRARDALLLVGTAGASRAATRWADWSARADSDHPVLAAGSYLDWLGPWWTRQIEGVGWLDVEHGQTTLFSWRIYSDDAAEPQRMEPEAAAADNPPAVEVQASPGQITALKARLAWRYPRTAATVEPAKATVSALRHRAWEEVEEDARPLPWARWPSAFARSGSRPPGHAGGLSAAERGAAHHRFLECAALDRLGSVVELRSEAARLAQEGLLSPAEIESLDFDALAAFWNSEPGRRIRGQPRATVHRELPFTARFTPRELAEAGVTLVSGSEAIELEGEFLVVQGTADLAVIQPQEIWLVDFKTDQVTAAELAARAAFYAPQLKLYSQALARIYARPVTQRWLHFLEARQTVGV